MAAATADIATKAMVTEGENDFDSMTQAFPPSHILQDGKFVFLPPPTDRNRIQFFERAVSRHGLIQGYLDGSKEEEKDDAKNNASNDDARKIHPLAMSSARLQADGVNELNRAINLNTLVTTDEYFALSNIVDPSLEQAVNAETTGGAAGAATATKQAAGVSTQQEISQKTKALVVCKRKMKQFEKAAFHIRRHKKRLINSIVAQQQPDRRLRRLRPQWRLVAPEHGTRALPHATRPTEVLAADVDLHSTSLSSLGRLASRVPRYATVELRSDYVVDDHAQRWTERVEKTKSSDGKTEEATDETPSPATAEKDVEDTTVWTQAEAFSIADPALGKLDADFDPSRVTMLSIQFVVQKSSTGFSHSECLKPISVITPTKSEAHSREDEAVLVNLQHSLFCAKLFESIRRELTPDTADIGQLKQTASLNTGIWLSSESEENFVGAPSAAPTKVNTSTSYRPKPLNIVHCHEGEVVVQLDCEYDLRVKLVERSEADDRHDEKNKDSGSQSGKFLSVLCQTLLHHAQKVYHLHSIKMEEKRQAEDATKTQKTSNLMAWRSKDVCDDVPFVLHKTVALGSKTLFEQRIRKTLMSVGRRLQSRGHWRLEVEWLPLSAFDYASHFVISYGPRMCLDATLSGDEVTISHTSSEGFYCKANFYADSEFELFLMKMAERQPHN